MIWKDHSAPAEPTNRLLPLPLLLLLLLLLPSQANPLSMKALTAWTSYDAASESTADSRTQHLPAQAHTDLIPPQRCRSAGEARAGTTGGSMGTRADRGHGSGTRRATEAVWTDRHKPQRPNRGD